MRNDESYGATVENKALANVSDHDRYKNPKTSGVQGLEEALKFHCGVHRELVVEGWKTRESDEGRARGELESR